MAHMTTTEGFYKPSAEERLARLLESETIRSVDDGKFTAKYLDFTLNNLRKQVDDLSYQHFLDLSEITRLRRYVEFLIGHDNTEV